MRYRLPGKSGDANASRRSPSLYNGAAKRTIHTCQKATMTLSYGRGIGSGSSHARNALWVDLLAGSLPEFTRALSDGTAPLVAPDVPTVRMLLNRPSFFVMIDNDNEYQLQRVKRLSGKGKTFVEKDSPDRG